MSRVSDLASSLCGTLKGAVKIALQSRPSGAITSRPENRNRALYILANGPSLRETIDRHASKLSEVDTLAVNFAANAPEFTVLRPKYYVLADPHFFNATSDVNVRKLLDNIASVSWPMTLFVDRRYRKRLNTVIKPGDNVIIETFNAVGIEGFSSFEKIVFKTGLAMPRPRNVLIPSIMIGLRLGYRTIYISGADHSWMRDLWVDDDNSVVSGMNHFYKDSEKEVKRTVSEYRSYRLHDIVYSYYIAFRSYHQIERYARSIGADIFNATRGSFIDAFRRSELPL